MKSNFYNICAKRTCRIVQIAKYAPALCPKITHSHSFPRRMETPFSTKYQTIFRLFAGYRRTCVAGAKRKPERIGGTKRGALVPRRQPSPRSVVLRHRPENKVFRLVARQNPFTERILAAPPRLRRSGSNPSFSATKRHPILGVPFCDLGGFEPERRRRGGAVKILSVNGF